MLTWGSVIYNDILAPLRRRQPWSQRFGLFVNRTIVACIGVFLLVYGLWYPLRGSLWDYLTITATIYMASMSVLLIACCYWPRANNWGAAAAIAVGAVIPSTYLVMEQVQATQELAEAIGPYWSGIAAFALTAAAMVVGSLLKPLFVSGQPNMEISP
jgi:SSS family solute:Na+ symporter